MTAAIVDVKVRFKVIRHLMSNLVFKMPIFGEFWVIFLWGEEIYELLGVYY